MKKIVKFALVACVLALPLVAKADAPDASAIVTTATTTLEAVETLVAGAVGFFVVVKIVKWIRK